MPHRQHLGWEGYTYGSKTSMSTAFASGAAALLISARPSLHNHEIMDILRKTADDVNASSYPGYDDYIGYGRINLKRAMDQVVTQKSILILSAGEGGTTVPEPGVYRYDTGTMLSISVVPNIFLFYRRSMRPDRWC